MRQWTREAWARFDDGAAHHIVIVKPGRWRRRRYYLDGDRASVRHPHIQRFMSSPYYQAVFGRALPLARIREHWSAGR